MGISALAQLGHVTEGGFNRVGLALLKQKQRQPLKTALARQLAEFVGAFLNGIADENDSFYR